MKMPVYGIYAAVVAIIAALLFAGCADKIQSGEGAGSGLPEQTAPTEANVPDNVVHPTAPTEPSEEIGEGSSDISETDDTPQSEQSSEIEENSEPEEIEETETADDETKAMTYLKLLNSDKIHVKFVQVSSFDGENTYSVEREFYIDGSDRIYINDNLRTVVHAGRVTVMDLDEGTYYSYDDEGDYGLNFGYYPSMYTLLSSSYENGELIEVYSVDSMGLTSTWTFSDDGGIKVADRGLDESYFDLFNFSVIDTSVGSMDFSIPDGFVEIDPDEAGGI